MASSAAKAAATGRKVVVGYILRHHPSWQRLIADFKFRGRVELAATLAERLLVAEAHDGRAHDQEQRRRAAAIGASGCDAEPSIRKTEQKRVFQ